MRNLQEFVPAAVLVVHNELKCEKKIQFHMQVWIIARLPEILKSMFFEKNSSLRVSFMDLNLNFFQKMLILAFEANSAVQCPAKMRPKL